MVKRNTVQLEYAKSMKSILKLDDEVLGLTYNLEAILRDGITGEVVERKLYHNIIPTVGRTAIMSWLCETSPSPATIKVNYVAVGTGTTAPANSDTQLQTETYRNALYTGTKSGSVGTLTGFFSMVETSGTFREAGLFIAGTGTVNSGTLLSHVAINITKSLSQTLTLIWTLTLT